MTARFIKACDFVLKWETEFKSGHDGDFAFARTERDPADPGGTTKFGIDQRSHPGVDIENLTVDGARVLYLAHYWNPSHAEELPVGLGEAVFDAAVNCGLGSAARWLQQHLIAIGLYGGAIDGRIGSRTLTAVVSVGWPRMPAFIEMYLNRRRQYYRHLADQKPKMQKYLQGWLARVDDLQKFIQALPSA